MKQPRHSHLRILMVIPRLQSGGAERQMGYLSRGLTVLGHEIIVATLQTKEDTPPGWCRDVQLHRLGRKSNYDPRLVIDLSRLIRRVQPDIVQTWNPQTDILGGLAAIINSRLWVIREPSFGVFCRSGWKAKLRARLGAKAAAVISNSSGGAASWNTLYPAKITHVIPNGLPLTAIHRIEPADRQELGLKGDERFIIYAGRLIQIKRVDRIIAAVEALRPHVEAVLFVCGEGEKAEELKAQVRIGGFEDWIRFTGWLKTEMIWSMMKSADLFINFSDYEGMPNTVMEAMACGCPLLVSDIPAHREILNEQSALLVDPRDGDAVAQALLFLLSNRAKARELARVAAELTSCWSIKTMAQNYERLYRSVINARG